MIPKSKMGDIFIVFGPCACTKMQRDIHLLRCNCMTLRQAEDSSSHKPMVLLDFSLTVKAAPHECVIRTSQP